MYVNIKANSHDRYDQILVRIWPKIFTMTTDNNLTWPKNMKLFLGLV